MELVHITSHDRARQAAFVRYVPKVFQTADFSRWRAAGEWTDAYTTHAIVDEGEVLANVSVMRMTVAVDGCEFAAYQLGAVGTVPAARGRGLAARVMRAALDAIGDAPSFLFANRDVLDFYPRFGFQPLAQVVHSIPWTAGRVAASERIDDITRLDTNTALERLRTAAYEPRAAVPGFTARRYEHVLSWYLCSARPPEVHVLGDHALAFTERDGATFRLLDLMTTRSVDLAAVLASLIDAPTDRVEFGFAPDVRAVRGLQTRIDADAHCFIRNFPKAPPAASQFPLLART